MDSSGHLHVVWDDNTPGSYAIYYKRSTDEGATWTANKRLTWNSGNSLQPAWPPTPLANSTSFGTIRLLEMRRSITRRVLDGGTTWTPNKRLTWNSGSSSRPAVAVDSNGVHIVYHDWTPGNAEIYYKYSPDGGETWAASKRLTHSADSSGNPGIGTDPSGNLHVVWNDATPETLRSITKSTPSRVTDNLVFWLC